MPYGKPFKLAIIDINGEYCFISSTRGVHNEKMGSCFGSDRCAFTGAS